jgi:Flp pilus assembly pilin Flp
MGNKVKQFMEDESGMGVVEVILIIVVLISLVLIFQDQIENLVESIFQTMTTNAGKVH